MNLTIITADGDLISTGGAPWRMARPNAGVNAFLEIEIGTGEDPVCYTLTASLPEGEALRLHTAICYLAAGAPGFRDHGIVISIPMLLKPGSGLLPVGAWVPADAQAPRDADAAMEQALTEVRAQMRRIDVTAWTAPELVAAIRDDLRMLEHVSEANPPSARHFAAIRIAGLAAMIATVEQP